jgi:hypothetical protein
LRSGGDNQSVAEAKQLARHPRPSTVPKSRATLTSLV